jgi:hypothetical protein
MASLRPITNGRDLDRNPRTGVPFSGTVETVPVLLSKILLGHGMMVHSQ